MLMFVLVVIESLLLGTERYKQLQYIIHVHVYTCRSKSYMYVHYGDFFHGMEEKLIE